MLKKVVITDYQYDSLQIERAIVENAGFSLHAYQCKDEESLISATCDADAVVVQYASITEAVIRRMKCCKVIVRYGIGIENISVQAATRQGIYVCNVPDYGIDEVSNHAIALMMALSRKALVCDRSVRSGEWDYHVAAPIYRFAGSTIGLVGFGRIPQMVAHKLAGFNARLITYDPYVKDALCNSSGVEKVAFETLLKQSDIVSIHCPLTEDTYHLFDREAFLKMKPSAFLVNTARGQVINEGDLVEALERKRIAGAGLDVFESEPLSLENPLLRLENVVLTPHSAWYSEQAIQALHASVAHEAVRVLKGEAPLNARNLPALDK